jgi:hypothetical protein
MRLLARVILTLGVAVLGGIQAVIFTQPVSAYYLRPKLNSGDIFGTGASIVNIFVSIVVFAFVFSGLFVFLIIGYRESMAVRLMFTALTLAVSVGTAIAIFEPKLESWAPLYFSAAVFFIGMVWTFLGTRKSVTS